MTAARAGDDSYDAMELHDRTFYAQRVEHTLSFAPGGGEGGGAWTMTVAGRSISSTML